MPHPFNRMFVPGNVGPAGVNGMPAGDFDPFQMLFGPGGFSNAAADFGGMPGWGPGGFQMPMQQQADPRPSGPPATSAATLRSLPRIKVTPYDLAANEGTECSICLDELVAGQPALRIPCGHLYHEDCVKDWLKKSNECPVCRFELPTDDAEYERGRRMRMAGRKLRMRMQDLTVKTVQELQRLAGFIAVDVKGCLEKSDLVERIAASPQVQIIQMDPCEAAGASSPSGSPGIFSSAQLDGLCIAEVKALMERLGVDSSGCLEKADMLQRLGLSGRILVTNDDTEACGAEPQQGRQSTASREQPDVVMGDASAGDTAAGSAAEAPTVEVGPLTGKSVGELRQLAHRLGVSLDGCLEKGELVQRIQAAPGLRISSHAA